MLKKIVVIAALGVLAGCANMPGTSDSEKVDKMEMSYLRTQITPGKTTKADVQRMFGTPAYKDESPRGDDLWSYEEKQINGNLFNQVLGMLPSFGQLGDAAVNSQRPLSRSLNINFNANGTVSTFSVSGSTGASR